MLTHHVITSINSNMSNTTAKEIQITQIDNPHKFWYKYRNDSEQEKIIQQFEEDIAKYAIDLVEWQENLPPIKHGDVVAAFHIEWRKWIRGKAGKMKNDEQMYIWAIDYGCKLLIPIENIVPIEECDFKYRQPINVYIGGLANIVPAEVGINIDTLATETVKINTWSRKAIELLTDWTSARKKITYEIKSNESNRSFGQLMLYSNKDNIASCAASKMCEFDVALRDNGFINDVPVLNMEDFLRKNHDLALLNCEEVSEDGNPERLWVNDDQLSSIDAQSGGEPEVMVSTQVNTAKNPQRCPSSTQNCSGFGGNSMSTASLTLSIKALNKLNLLIIADETNITPAKEWSDAIYFPENMKNCLRKLYPKGIELPCSYGWPNIMRGNSLLLIGEPNQNTLLCLPTVCSITWRLVSNWSLSLREEPVAIIFVKCAEDVNRMATLCRKFLQKSAMNNVNVFCLNSSFEINALMGTNNIDILVMPVFCYQSFADHEQMSLLFKSGRLRYIWFDQIDEMCGINQSETVKTLNIFLAQNIQVVVTSATYCPVFHELHLFQSLPTLPVLLIGHRTPFEAALFSNCLFLATYIKSESKIKDLIRRLNDPNTILTGSIVIMCVNKAEVKYVTGYLTQANIRCIEFDEHFSGNQIKLLNWSNRCQLSENNVSNRNILVCYDANLSIFPIRTATHLIHFSLPNKLEEFLYRYITCYGFYNDRLQRELLDKEDELIHPVSLAYFDENFCEDYIEIFEALSNRTKCVLPSDLKQTVTNMRIDIEHSKANTPLCVELITTAKNCNTNCPYRHILTGCNHTYIPEFGFVNMELLDVIAPNHFAVRVVGHKRHLVHKSKPVRSLHDEWVKFEENLCKFYAENECKSLYNVKTGDLCVLFQQNQPKRCRVLSKSKDSIRVYLIDIGKTRHYTINDLYYLEDEFHGFPSQVIEVIALGYVPSDYSSVWLPEATQCVKQLMKTFKKQSTTDCYLQAEVIKTFDRTLIVENVQILNKIQNRHRSISIARHLIKSRFADEADIELHYILTNDDDSDQAMAVSVTDFKEKASILEEEEFRRYFANTPSDSESPFYGFDDFDDIEEGNDNIASVQGFNDSVGLWRSEQIGTKDEPVAPANSPVSDDHAFEMKQSEATNDFNGQNNNNSSTINGTAASVTSTLSLDEILGSLPENIQAKIPPSLIKFSLNDEVDHAKKPDNDTVDWLIDFSESDNNNTTVVAPPLFSSVRVINSFDDLL